MVEKNKPKEETLSLEQLIKMSPSVTFPNKHNEWFRYDIHLEEGNSVYYYVYDGTVDPPVYRYVREVRK